MLADWSAECSADDPHLVLPWHDPANPHSRFINLRTDPYDIHDIPEADLYPALSRALRSLNATRSPFLTAKCDAWPLTPTNDHADTLESLRLELNLDPDHAHVGFASYIDILFRERTLFASAHQQQDRLDRITRRAAKLPHTDAALECILRPAVIDLSSTLEGFAITLYVTALGVDAESALASWSAALEDVTHLLRAKDLEPTRGSATIDEAVQRN